MSESVRPPRLVTTWAVVVLIVGAGVAASLPSAGPSDERASGPDSGASAPPSTPTAAAAAEAPLEQSPPAEDPPTTVAPVEVNTSTVDEELRSALNIDEYSDVWREAPSSWAGYIQDVSVQGANVAVTLGIEPDQRDRDRIAEDAALAISVILPAELAAGIDWIIVKDAGGVELARAEPKPADVGEPPTLGFLG